jgi:hypothetical protein
VCNASPRSFHQFITTVYRVQCEQKQKDIDNLVHCKRSAALEFTPHWIENRLLVSCDMANFILFFCDKNCIQFGNKQFKLRGYIVRQQLNYYLSTTQKIGN